jgi:membrane-associated protease RseP (regulator of RpoE activity)
VLIANVTKGSPAEKAGMQMHDVLVELDGKRVPAALPELTSLIDGIKSASVDAVVYRKGKREVVRGIKLQAAAPTAPREYEKLLAEYYRGATALTPKAAAVKDDQVMTTTFRRGDRVTTRYQEGSLIIHVIGTVSSGRFQVSEITVQDGAVSHKYDRPEQVPAQYRDKVMHLIETSGKTPAPASGR